MHNGAVVEFTVRLADEALFIEPGSGRLWTFDFGNKTEVIKEADGEGGGAPFQVAQATVDERELFLVLPPFGTASLAEQDRIFSMLREHDAERPVAVVVERERGKLALIAGDADLVGPAAAAAAVVRTCWEWDQSTEFSINVDQRDYTVRPRHDGEVWRASVERSPI